MSILKNDSPIGFFDSGVGGLTVLKHFKNLLPNENIIFFGDTAHVPYGEKTKDQLVEYSKNILSFFDEKNCKAVVMACNTTSSLIYDCIKPLYDFELYPIVQSVAKVLAQLPVSRLGVFATKATITSKAYEKSINKYNPQIKIYGQFCPEWVKIVETNSAKEMTNIHIIKEDLMRMLKNSPDKIVLGCTHYPYLLPVLAEFAPKDLFIDPSISFAEFLKNDLGSKNLLKMSSSPATDEFYVSSNPKQFRESAKMFYDLGKEPELVIF